MLRSPLPLLLPALVASLGACGAGDVTTPSLSEHSTSEHSTTRDGFLTTRDGIAMSGDRLLVLDDGRAPPRDARRSDSGSTGADTLWTPRSGPPRAKGLWIWYFSYTGYTADQLATMAQAMGVGYVLIKSGMDSSFWTTRYNAAAVASFTSRGIHVLAWPYLTPVDVTGDVTASVQAAMVPGTDGLVLDVECEWEGGSGGCCGSGGCSADYSAQAKQLCQGIRSGAPGVWLAYTSFGWVGYHSNFPFGAFDQYCGDAFFPQVYYSDRDVTWNGPKGYMQAEQMIITAGLKAPVWMIQSNDDYPSGGSPTVTDLNGFFDTIGAYSSLWEWPATAETAKQAQLPMLHWPN